MARCYCYNLGYCLLRSLDKNYQHLVVRLDPQYITEQA